MAPVKSTLYWTRCDHPGPIIYLFEDKSSGARFFGVQDDDLEGFVDDTGIASPSSWLRNRTYNCFFVQRFLLHELFPISDPRILRGIESARNRVDISFLPLEDRVSHFEEALARALFDQRPSTEQTFSEIPKNPGGVLRELTWLSVFERFKLSPEHIIEPDSLAPDLGMEYVTSGSQTGLGSSTERFKCYLRRFLDWHALQYKGDGVVCIVPLQYVHQLCPISSMLGFLLALAELPPLLIEDTKDQ